MKANNYVCILLLHKGLIKAKTLKTIESMIYDGEGQITIMMALPFIILPN